VRSPISPSQRFRVFQRDRFVCQYCGARPPEIQIRVDHIRPVADGGDNSDSNLITSCFECNAGKAAKPVTSFALDRKVWGVVRRLPHRHPADAVYQREVASAVTQAFTAAGIPEVLLDVCKEQFANWREWETKCNTELFVYYALMQEFAGPEYKWKQPLSADPSSCVIQLPKSWWKGFAESLESQSDALQESN